MSFLFKLTIAILIVFAILFPILISSDNKLSALFWKIPKDFWVFLIIMYGAIITVVFIESSEQARIRRQQYLQQYKMPNEIHENVVIENSIISRETTDDESDINTLYLDSFKSKNNCKSFETNSNLLDKNGKPVEISKRTARAVLTGMCYSAGSAMRHGSSSLTRLTGQSAMTPSTWRR